MAASSDKAGKAFELTDRSLDPVGVIAVFVLLMVQKFTSVRFSVDEVLWASMALGSARVLWERHKRQRQRSEIDAAENKPGQRPF